MDPRPDGYEYECICADKLRDFGHKFACQAYNLRRMKEQSQSQLLVPTEATDPKPSKH